MRERSVIGVLVALAIIGIGYMFFGHLSDPPVPRTEKHDTGRQGSRTDSREGHSETAGLRDPDNSATITSDDQIPRQAEKVPVLAEGTLKLMRDRAISRLKEIERQRIRILKTFSNEDGGINVIYALLPEPSEQDIQGYADALRDELNIPGADEETTEKLRSLRESIYKQATDFPCKYKIVMLGPPTEEHKSYVIQFSLNDPTKVQFGEDGAIEMLERTPLPSPKPGPYSGIARFGYLIEDAGESPNSQQK